MTRDEIVTALREHAEWARANEWESPITLGDDLSAAADAQGIKERIAMDIERYGDCKVVSIVSDRGREEQMTMKGD